MSIKASKILETLEALQKKYDPEGEDEQFNELIEEVESAQCSDCGGFAIHSNDSGQYCQFCYDLLPCEDDEMEQQL